jgi:hypothetical protein
MVNKVVWFFAAFGLILAGLAGQFMLAQHSEIKYLQKSLQLQQEYRRINDDDIRSLVAELQQARSQAEGEKTRQFVAGVVAATQDPKPFAEIWHAGYDRGAAAQQYADTIAKDKTYTTSQDPLK